MILSSGPLSVNGLIHDEMQELSMNMVKESVLYIHDFLMYLSKNGIHIFFDYS